MISLLGVAAAGDRRLRAGDDRQATLTGWTSRTGRATGCVTWPPLCSTSSSRRGRSERSSESNTIGSSPGGRAAVSTACPFPLRLIRNESRPDRRDALERRIAALPADPALVPDVRPAADFAAAYSAIDSLAHPGRDQQPTLWILDPFDISSLPFSLVRQCLARPRDEVLITWFADEIYRFCERAGFDRTLNTHYGNTRWQGALAATTEQTRKAALVRAYRDGLEALPNVKTSEFSIASKNATARYAIVFATHSDSGLACWNPVTWGLDPAAGRSASERRSLQQDALFDERAALRDALNHRAGTAVRFDELRTEAGRLGFVDRQLRVTLDEMRADGRAVRENHSTLEAHGPRTASFGSTTPRTTTDRCPSSRALTRESSEYWSGGGPPTATLEVRERCARHCHCDVD
jgi:three-Cys-motif partner protein